MLHIALEQKHQNKLISIHSLMESKLKHDPNFLGQQYQIILDSCTAIKESKDAYRDRILFDDILEIINN